MTRSSISPKDAAVALVPAIVVVVALSFAAQARVPQLDGRLLVLALAGVLGGAVAFVAVERGAAAGRPENVTENVTESVAELRTARADSSAPQHPGPVPAVARAVGPAAPAGASLALSIEKMGSTPDECEDAFSVDMSVGRLAVADGASSSFDARPWALQLACGFVAGAPAHGDLVAFDGWVRAQQQSTEAAKASESSTPSGWWGDEGSRRGGFATLLGVELVRDRTALVLWRSVAVGDSCVLQVRPSDQGRVVTSFPVEPGGSFGSHPALLHSLTDRGSAGSIAGVRWAAGRLEPDDVLLLLTDAVAEWVLADRTRVRPLLELAESDLVALLVNRRASGEIVNDDLTVVRYVHRSIGGASS